MKKSEITVHMVIRNEEQWVWYAIKSVIDYVTRLIIFDTGSVDRTAKIIHSFRNSKIIFSQKGNVSAKELVKLRNEQIAQTRTEWFMLLDGDEVWPQATILELVKVIQRAESKVCAIVVKARLPVGDLFHYQPEIAGRYQILGKTGHYNIRAYRKKAGYRWQGTYPLEAYTDSQGIPVQKKESELMMLKGEYWHLTHLRRSPVEDHRKHKLEFGKSSSVRLPEVFFVTRPQIVPSPWVCYTPTEKLFAKGLAPLLRIKRLLNK